MEPPKAFSQAQVLDWRRITVGKRIYVGNLSYDTTDSSLRALFEQAGAVDDATIITDQYSGRSKGFGFVEMTEDAAGDDAIQRFNGVELDGRTLKVAEARPRRSRESSFDNRW